MMPFTFIQPCLPFFYCVPPQSGDQPLGFPPFFDPHFRRSLVGTTSTIFDPVLPPQTFPSFLLPIGLPCLLFFCSIPLVYFLLSPREILLGVGPRRHSTKTLGIMKKFYYVSCLILTPKTSASEPALSCTAVFFDHLDSASVLVGGSLPLLFFCHIALIAGASSVPLFLRGAPLCGRAGDGWWLKTTRSSSFFFFLVYSVTRPSLSFHLCVFFAFFSLEGFGWCFPLIRVLFPILSLFFQFLDNAQAVRSFFY